MLAANYLLAQTFDGAASLRRSGPDRRSSWRLRQSSLRLHPQVREQDSREYPLPEGELMFMFGSEPWWMWQHTLKPVYWTYRTVWSQANRGQMTGGFTSTWETLCRGSATAAWVSLSFSSDLYFLLLNTDTNTPKASQHKKHSCDSNVVFLVHLQLWLNILRFGRNMT